MDLPHTNRLFATAHLPPHLAQISGHFRDLAFVIHDCLPPSAERTLALRDLWASKNQAVMAAVIAHQDAPEAS